MPLGRAYSIDSSSAIMAGTFSARASASSLKLHATSAMYQPNSFRSRRPSGPWQSDAPCTSNQPKNFPSSKASPLYLATISFSSDLSSVLSASRSSFSKRPLIASRLDAMMASYLRPSASWLFGAPLRYYAARPLNKRYCWEVPPRPRRTKKRR